MESLKKLVLFYINHLYLVDYMLILLVFFLFTCICFLCVFLRHRTIIALIIMALNIVLCFFVFLYGYKFIDYQVRSRHTTISEQKKMHNSQALIIDFTIANTSKHNFKTCKVTAKIYKDKLPQDTFLTEMKHRFIPYRVKSTVLKDLNKSMTQFQRIAFDNFIYENNYTLRMKSECF
ncbi:DUF2393 family protein [Campylobacter sp. MIT 21-1685]|uniref:DUF2393 family protein n=1 Tax=unclassified Campylobacter TaxID=2593542 RepID=UPI00224B53D9|nr:MULTISPECIES: DUF2393 family protein [unclassified Campylobacter]MCX2683083.1 DUF2393 family protein [Campylobacter sp. MIT 21-1684]MCX2751365.1 DUF2393 family protein [Campylobacter sp. MIT 21-1682]MCX2807564.1 DUF2393 family protein [Campylobacter sp. MIT 21-1685]